MMATLRLDPLVLVGLVVVAFAVIGWRRGPRAEAITLTALVFPALLFSNNVTRERLIAAAVGLLGQVRAVIAGGAPAPVLGDGQRFVVGLVILAGLLAAAYAIGAAYGEAARKPDPIGAALGGISGLLTATTLLAMGHADLGMAVLRVTPPTVEVALPSDRHVLIEYAPVVFSGAFFLVAALAWRQVKRSSGR